MPEMRAIAPAPKHNDHRLADGTLCREQHGPHDGRQLRQEAHKLGGWFPNGLPPGPNDPSRIDCGNRVDDVIAEADETNGISMMP